MLLDLIHLFHIVKVEYGYFCSLSSALLFSRLLALYVDVSVDICLPCSSVSVFAHEGDCSSGISWI